MSFYLEYKRDLFYLNLYQNNKCRYKYENSVKRSDVTGNHFEWQLDENKVI